jgi:hypothetical protein
MPDIEQLVECFPAHKCSLTIEHNGYRDYYETIADAVEELEGYWVSPEERERALSTGEVWTIQWYPDTPVGFHRVAASTLTAAINGTGS